MTPDQINAAIAEFCGWRWSMQDEAYYVDGQYRAKELPNYYADLNAVHEAERRLPGALWDRYTQWLREVTKSNRRYFIATATAPQRCEALLRTLGRWVDDTATLSNTPLDTPKPLR